MNHSPVHGIFTKPQEAGSINYPWGHINSYSPRDHLTRTSHETRMILTNQDWVGYAATASRPPTLSGLSLCVCVPHSPSTGLTVLVFLYSWSCSCALRNRWQLLRSRRQERKAKNTQETLPSQTGSDNTTLLPIIGQNQSHGPSLTAREAGKCGDSDGYSVGEPWSSRHSAFVNEGTQA